MPVDLILVNILLALIYHNCSLSTVDYWFRVVVFEQESIWVARKTNGLRSLVRGAAWYDLRLSWNVKLDVPVLSKCLETAMLFPEVH